MCIFSIDDSSKLTLIKLLIRLYFQIEGEILLNSVNINEYNVDHLDKVCEECGLLSLKKKLSKGYDTEVDKWNDEEGLDLSGGEGQLSAITRACYNDGVYTEMCINFSLLSPRHDLNFNLSKNSR